MKLLSGYELNLESVKADFKECSDFLIREVVICGVRAFFCAMDGLVNSLSLNELVIEPALKCSLEFGSNVELSDKLKKSVFGAIELSEAQTFEDAYFLLMSGFALLYVEGSSDFIAFGVQGWEKRSVEEPTNEAMVKGAKECFTETLNDNKAMLRKRLKTNKLKLKQIKLGTQALTPVALAYIQGRADEKNVEEVERRLKAARLQNVLDFGALGEYLQGERFSFFSGTGNTERPDVLASKLLEGRIGVMVEGTPFVIYLPYLFTDNFSSLDDYDNPPLYASFIRLLKYLSFAISLFLPALYVAIGTFHQEMFPTLLLYIVATSEATTPFPLVVEAIIIHILYEIMREAGLRLPKTIGHAVSIIGAIVIGEAMVSAGIISEPMLVVVALTAIASYVVYPLYESVAVLRFFFIAASGLWGIYGFTLSACVLLVNICSLSTQGVPYSVPLSPLTVSSLGDTVIRQSWKKLSKRKVNIQNLNGADNGEKH